MPVVLQSLKTLKEREANVEQRIDRKDIEAVHILIQCGEKFLEDASIG